VAEKLQTCLREAASAKAGRKPFCVLSQDSNSLPSVCRIIPPVSHKVKDRIWSLVNKVMKFILFRIREQAS
jgi:hypothetical protein